MYWIDTGVEENNSERQTQTNKYTHTKQEESEVEVFCFVNYIVVCGVLECQERIKQSTIIIILVSATRVESSLWLTLTKNRFARTRSRGTTMRHDNTIDWQFDWIVLLCSFLVPGLLPFPQWESVKCTING